MMEKMFPERIAERIVQAVLDMDDRTSPESDPSMLLVTGQELHDFVLLAFERETCSLEAPLAKSGELQQLRRIKAAAAGYLKARDSDSDRQGLAWTELNAALCNVQIEEPVMLGPEDPTVPAPVLRDTLWTEEGDPIWFRDLSEPNRSLARSALSAEYCRGRDDQARAAEVQRNPSGFPP